MDDVVDPVEELFELAADLPPERRRAFLDARATEGASAAVRAEVESLLAQLDLGGGSFLERPAYGAASVEHAGVPERVGRYRVIRCIGQGGMAAVYEAEQEEPRRSVALKILHEGPRGRTHVRRFQRETLVLARLRHPGIAQIYEAGTLASEDGTPPRHYFAMELVDGLPLDAYAYEQRLGIRERLELVAELCDAVHFAHERGVVHRDLKPANVLVDDQGRPKVLDFGVARATGEGLPEPTQHTQAGQVVGTLAYMSPEQVLGRSEELDARSDVYALGVILYQLLAGRLPYELAGLSMPEAGRVILEVEPPRLGQQDPGYRGDVETIVAKALEKEKERRYRSALELAADLRRHLADEPIAARPPTTIYRFRKFARRNRGLVAGVSAALAVLVVALVSVSASAVRLQREKVRAEEINRFLESILSAAASYQQFASSEQPRHFGANARLVDVLDEGVQRLEEEPLRDPLAEARIHLRMAVGYHGVGRYVEGAQSSRRALALLADGPRSREPLRLEALQGLAYNLAFLGDTHEAVRRARELVARAERAYREHDQEMLDALHCLHFCSNYAGYMRDSGALCERVLELVRSNPRASGYAHLMAKAELARLWISHLHRPVEGEALAREALAEGLAGGYERTNGIGLAHFALGRAAAVRGDFQEAEEHCRRGLAIWTALAGETPALEFHPLLAHYVRRQPGREEEGLAILRDAASARREQFGPDDSMTGWLVGCHAWGLLWLGRYADAEERFRAYFTVVERSGLPDTHGRARDCHGIALAHLRQGETEDAERWLREGLRIAALFTRAEWTRHWWDDRILHVELAELLQRQGRSDEAEELHALLRTRLDERGDPVEANRVAWRLSEAGRHAEAERIARVAVEELRPLRGQVARDFVAALDTWACALQSLGGLDRAAAAWREADALWAVAPAELRGSEEIAIRYAKCLTALGDFEAAEAVLRRTDAALRDEGTAGARATELQRSAAEATTALYEAWGKHEFAARDTAEDP